MADYKENGEGKGLVIVTKYKEAERWLYGRILNMSNKHATMKKIMLNALLNQYSLFYLAAKTNDINNIMKADAGLAYIKELVTCMADPKYKLLSLKQACFVFVILSDVGSMLGAWRKKVESKLKR